MDFALNFDDEHKFKEPGIKPLSLQQQYFELKCEQLKLFEHREDTKNYKSTQKEIISLIKSIKPNDDTFRHHALIESILSGVIWNNIALNPYEQLQKIAPLMRYYDRNTADELRFLIKNEKLIIALLKDEDTEDIANAIASDINALSTSISKVQDKEPRIRQVLTPLFWQQITIESIKEVKQEFTSLMKYRNPQKADIIITDIQDTVIERRWIEYTE